MPLRPYAALAGLLTACTASTPPAPTRSGPAEAPAAPTARGPDPSPVVLAAPPRPGAPADAAFQLVAYRDGEIDLHVLGDSLFVLGALDITHLDADGTRLIREEADLATLAEPSRRSGDWEVIAFGGAWPEPAWLIDQHEDGSTMRPAIQVREGGRWRRLDNRDRDLVWYYTDIVAFDGRLLGLRVAELGADLEDAPPGGRLAAAQRRLAATPPRFDVLGPRPTAAPLKIARDFEPRVAAVAPTGELFLLGRSTSPRAGGPTLLRWDPGGASTGVASTLPIDASCGSLAVRSATEVYVTCDQRGALLRHDGAAWSQLHVPGDMSPLDLAVAPEGALWLVLDRDRRGDGEPATEVWRLTPGAAWERVALPALGFPDRGEPGWVWNFAAARQQASPAAPDEAARTWPVTPLGVLARAGGDVWIRGFVDIFRDDLGALPVGRSVVLRSRATGEPLRLRTDGELLLAALDRRPAPAWTAAAGCPGGQPAFVTLRTLPPDAPLDRPEPAAEALARDPAARASITGVFEVHRDDRRAVGLFVRPADQAAADALLASLAALVPDEPHALECRQPRVRRELDRSTGQTLQAPGLQDR